MKTFQKIYALVAITAVLFGSSEVWAAQAQGNSSGCINQICDTGCPPEDDSSMGSGGSTKTSFFGYYSKEHRHEASDYEVELVIDGVVNCSTCVNDSFDEGYVSPSIGRLDTLSLKRYRRSLKYYGSGSFGGGHYSEYDDRLEIFYEDSWQGTGIGMVNVFVANDSGDARQFLERNSVNFNDNAVDGVYRDRWGFYKSLTLYDFQGNKTPNQAIAVTAILQYHDGRKLKFEIFEEMNQRRSGRLIERIDRNGNKTQITYVYPAFNSNLTGVDRKKLWQMDRVIDPYGNMAVFEYVYMNYGYAVLVSKVTIANQEINYSYDTSGNLSSIAYPDGTSSAFTYYHDPVEQMDVVVYNDSGAIGTHRRKLVKYTASSYQFDDGGVLTVTPGHFRRAANLMGEDLLAHWPSETMDIFFVYEGGGKLSRITAENGRAITKVEIATDYIHDPSVPVPDMSNLNFETKTTYDGVWYQSIVNEETDIFGRVTSVDIALDKRARTAMYFPDGTSYTKTLNDFNQPLVYTDRLGRVTTCVYDADGNMLSKTLATNTSDEATWAWTYNAKGQPLTSVDANGNVTTYTYNAQGYLESIIEPPDHPGDPSAVTSYAYNIYGTLLTVTDPVGRITTYKYDARNRISEIEYSDTSTEKFTYGSGNTDQNLLTELIDRNGNKTIYGYDSYGRKNHIIYGAGTPEQVEETCGYVSGTTLLGICIDRGERTDWAYDHRQRLISSSVRPDIQTILTENYLYDNYDRLIEESDYYDRKTYYVYDVNDRMVRMVQETVPGGVGVLGSMNIDPSGGFLSIGNAGFAYLTSQRDEDLMALTRELGANAKYIIIDMKLDSEGQLFEKTDGRGYSDVYDYDNQGRSIQSIISAGTSVAAKTEKKYDAQGNVIEILRPRFFDVNDIEAYQQANNTFTYTGRNLLASETKAAGSAIAATRSYTYFLDRRLRNLVDFRGNIWSKLWHICCGRSQAKIDPTNSGVISNTDFNGNTTHTAVAANLSLDVSLYDWHNPNDIDTVKETTMRYDALNRVTHQTAWLVPLGTVVDHARANLGNGVIPIAGEDGIPVADGLTTHYLYDDDLTDGIGLDVTYANYLVNLDLGLYSDGQAVEVTNPENEKSVTIYDGIGRRVLFIDGNGNADTIEYDEIVNVLGYGDVVETSAQNALGHINSLQTDGLGRHVRSLDSEGNSYSYGYDANHNIITYRDPNGVGHDCVFDERDREISRTDTQGDVVSLTYDLMSNVIVNTDALSNNSTFVFDARDRMISGTNRINATTLYSYDSNNNRLAITDSEGGVTTYVYDSRNILKEETFPAGDAGTTHKNYAYDAGRRLISRTVNMSEDLSVYSTTNFVYDMASRLLERQYPQESNANDLFTYDNASRMLTASSNRYDNIINRTYDDASRLISESLLIDGTNYLLNYGYDAGNRQTSLIYPNGKIVVRGFTDRSQLSSLSYDGSDISSFQYDVGKREISRVFGNGISTTTTYRPDNLVLSIKALGVLDFSYTYDANKRKIQELDIINPSLSQVFSYDNEDRLIGWSTNLNTTNQFWTLSSEGDWDVTVRTGFNPINEVRTHSDVHESIGVNGNIMGYDYQGNLLNNSVKNQLYAWDDENRLNSVDINGGDLLAVYRYDALGRRVQKEVLENNNTVITTYISSGAQVLMEYENGIEKQSYVYATYVDEPIALIDSLGDVKFYHRNHLFSIEAITDSNGILIESYDYSSYGEVYINDSHGNVQANSLVDNPYRFAGRRLDSESNLYYSRTRYFDPSLGRFINRNPWKFLGGEFLSGYWIGNVDSQWQYRFVGLAFSAMSYFGDRYNLYEYAKGDPSNYLEPYSDTKKINNLKSEEGLENTVYKDSEGNRTIGYGTNLENGMADESLRDLGYDPEKVKDGEQKITDSDAERLLWEDAEKAVEDSRDLVNNYMDLDPDAKRILAEMVYQLGKSGTRKFKKMREALEEEDYDKAADEMEDSRWHDNKVGDGGTPARAARKVAEMRSAVGDEECDEEHAIFGYGAKEPETEGDAKSE